MERRGEGGSGKGLKLAEEEGGRLSEARRETISLVRGNYGKSAGEPAANLADIRGFWCVCVCLCACVRLCA